MGGNIVSVGYGTNPYPAPRPSVFLWLNLLLFGAPAFETSILYPNQFHDVPPSPALSHELMTEAGTGDLMRLADMATVIVGVLTLITMWRRRRVRGRDAARYRIEFTDSPVAVSAG